MNVFAKIPPCFESRRRSWEEDENVCVYHHFSFSSVVFAATAATTDDKGVCLLLTAPSVYVCVGVLPLPSPHSVVQKEAEAVSKRRGAYIKSNNNRNRKKMERGWTIEVTEMKTAYFFFCGQPIHYNIPSVWVFLLFLRLFLSISFASPILFYLASKLE